MHKPESGRENETHKILWDFEIRTDPLILARRPDIVIDDRERERERKRKRKRKREREPAD